MPELKDREIFAVGKWNGLEFDESDLDDIVANFEKLKDVHKPFLKFGHNDEQKITDGQPAIGWVSRVYRNGKKLFADFSDVPNVVYEAIKNKLYRTVSVELLFGVDHKDRRYNHVLDAVALLGADHPAVNTLDDLANLLAARTSFSGGRRVVFETVAGKKTSIDPTKEEDDMPISEEAFNKLQASVDKLVEKTEAQDKELSTLRRENAELKSEKEDFAKKERESKIKMARDAVNALLDGAVKDKKMTPAVRETYAKQIGVDDDERVQEIDLDQVKLMCGATKGTDASQQGRTGGDDVSTDESAEDQLYQKTRENMATTGEKDFSVAFSRVCAANPKLHKEYLDSNGVKGRD